MLPLFVCGSAYYNVVHIVRYVHMYYVFLCVISSEFCHNDHAEYRSASLFVTTRSYARTYVMYCIVPSTKMATVLMAKT